ncbi:MAG: hypothetical protein ACP5I3_10705, partial [Thermoproteus sp.]
CLSLGGGGTGVLTVAASQGLQVSVHAGLGLDPVTASNNAVHVDLIDSQGRRYRRAPVSTFRLKIKAPPTTVPVYFYLDFIGYDQSGNRAASADAWVVLGPDRTTDSICAGLTT